jgi:putative transposase
MPRANRYYLPGAVWHITHRCHDRQFLLRFERDRRRWRYWLYEARKRYGLTVLNYIATSNHVHLLMQDTAPGTIWRGMQLLAGRTAQEYNQRKSRKGAFWDDRYFATAVENDEHLVRCLVYIDLNMVRAGVVSHPAQWQVSGYHEIQTPPQRYRIIDEGALCRLTQISGGTALRAAHRQWVACCLSEHRLERDPKWTAAIAVGSEGYVSRMKGLLGPRAYHRSIDEGSDETFVIRE